MHGLREFSVVRHRYVRPSTEAQEEHNQATKHNAKLCDEYNLDRFFGKLAIAIASVRDQTLIFNTC